MKQLIYFDIPLWQKIGTENANATSMSKSAYSFVCLVAICSFLLMLTDASARAQGVRIIEVSEAAVQKSEEWTKDKAEEEKLSKKCDEATASYIEARETLDDWLNDLENVVVVNQLIKLKEDLEKEKNIPKECSAEIKKTIESLITKSFDVKTGSVDWDKVNMAASHMEKELIPIYKYISDTAELVCEECSYRPAKLKNDPIECSASDLQKNLSDKIASCQDAIKKYEREKDMLIYKRDMCLQKRKIERMDMILFWFQGRSDMPLTCAVEIKDFIDDLKESQDERRPLAHELTIMETMCGKGLFTVYRRFGSAVSSACESCEGYDPTLEKDGIDCF
ncbi:MAG: hypothetical protein ABH871_09030 [Pseudomonadota bacterium]